MEVFYCNAELAALLFDTQIRNPRGLIMQYGSGTNLIQSYGTFQAAHCSNIHKYSIRTNIIKNIACLRYNSSYKFVKCSYFGYPIIKLRKRFKIARSYSRRI
jgi:hypothetical protein